MTKAEKTKIIAWLDKQVELNEELKAAENCSKEIAVLDYGFGREIHIYKGLKKIAEAIGTDVMWRASTEYQKPRYYIEYKDYVFFSHVLKEDGSCI